MAREDQLAWPTLAEVTAAARAFVNPALTGGLGADWNPATDPAHAPSGVPVMKKPSYPDRLFKMVAALFCR